MSKKAISGVAASVKAVSPSAFSSSAKPQHGQKGKKKTEELQGFAEVPSGEPVKVINKHHSDGFAEKQMPDDPAWIGCGGGLG